jgi:hypothetical protein
VQKVHQRISAFAPFTSFPVRLERKEKKRKERKKMFRLFHSRAMLQTEMNAFKVDMKLMARIRKDREGG